MNPVPGAVAQSTLVSSALGAGRVTVNSRMPPASSASASEIVNPSSSSSRTRTVAS